MDIIEKVFQKVKRADFMPEDLKHLSEMDSALPIGFGQTISQPYTVRLMLKWLEVELGNKVLDIGAGSGWTTALLAQLTGSKGHVYAVEAIPELLEFGEQNCRRLGIRNVSFHLAGSEVGLPKIVPFDRILVSAAGTEIPKQLTRQLKRGGKMVIPIKHDILEVEKLTNGKLDVQVHEGFVFVPLV